jgi:uncharacterized protein (DUF1499 family)
MRQLPVSQNALIRVADGAHKSAAAILLAVMLGGCSGSPPSELGVRDGRLAPCPASPNCVNSQASDEQHAIAPLALRGSPEETRRRLLQLLADEPRVRLVVQEDDYLRAEFTSRVLRFVDDVEFLIEPQAVQVRSASRLGHSDLGVNRERVEHLRQRLAQQP